MDAEERALVVQMQTTMDHQLELIKLARKAIGHQQDLIEKLMYRVNELEQKLIKLEQKVRVGF